MILRILLLLLLVAGVAGAEDVCSLPLSKTVSLLGGRLEMQVPESGQLVQQVRSIMAAPDAVEEQTHVLIGSPPEARIVVMELFARPGKDFEGGVRAEVAGNPLTVGGASSLTPPLTGFEFLPSDPNSSAELIYGVYVQHTDGTVQRVAFYRRAPSPEIRKKCLAQARQMIATLRTGARRLRLGGPTNLGNDFVVTLPPEYSAVTQLGPDFVVYKIRKLGMLGQQRPLLGIYVGGYPSYQGGGKARGATLLGVDTHWEEDRTPGKMSAQALFPLGMKKCHMFIEAATAGELQELEGIGEALKKR